METQIDVTPASNDEKNRLVKFVVNNLRKEDFTLTIDEEIDSFFSFSKSFRAVNKIEIKFNGIKRILFSVILIEDVKEFDVYFDHKLTSKENCYNLEFHHSYFELINNEIQDITLDDFITLGKVND